MRPVGASDRYSELQSLFGAAMIIEVNKNILELHAPRLFEKSRRLRSHYAKRFDRQRIRAEPYIARGVFPTRNPRSAGRLCAAVRASMQGAMYRLLGNRPVDRFDLDILAREHSMKQATPLESASESVCPIGNVRTNVRHFCLL